MPSVTCTGLGRNWTPVVLCDNLMNFYHWARADSRLLSHCMQTCGCLYLAYSCNEVFHAHAWCSWQCRKYKGTSHHLVHWQLAGVYEYVRKAIFQTPLKTIGRMDGCYHLSVPLNLLMGISLWQCCIASVTAVTFSAAEHCHPVPNYASWLTFLSDEFRIATWKRKVKVTSN